jgi:hypothetical protein
MSQKRTKAGAIYSPYFLAKNDPNCMFFAPAKIIENYDFLLLKCT